MLGGAAGQRSQSTMAWQLSHGVLSLQGDCLLSQRLPLSEGCPQARMPDWFIASVTLGTAPCLSSAPAAHKLGAVLGDS